MGSDSICTYEQIKPGIQKRIARKWGLGAGSSPHQSRLITQSTTNVVDNLRLVSYIAGMNQQRPKPTTAELEILSVLWEHGPATVRAIHEILSQGKETGYTTTLKILQKMADKGLVTRDESRRSHIYHAAIQAEQTQRQLIDDLVRQAFGGATEKLVMQALSLRKVTPAEIESLRKLLDQLEEKSE
jgi:predicted transcriptional regulator